MASPIGRGAEWGSSWLMARPSVDDPGCGRHDVPKLSRKLRGRPFVEIEQPSKPSTTNHWSSSMLGGGVRHYQHINETLVIALLMKMHTYSRSAGRSIPCCP